MPVYDIKITDGHSFAVPHMDLTAKQASYIQKLFHDDMKRAREEGWDSMAYCCRKTGDLVRIRVLPTTRCIRVKRLAPRRRPITQQEMFA